MAKLLMPDAHMHTLKLGPHVRSMREAPLSLTTLAATVPDSDIEWRIVDGSVDAIPLDAAADLIGISVITGTAVRAYRMADHFRRRGLPVVLGGVHVTILPGEAMLHADSVVIGMGVLSLAGFSPLPAPGERLNVLHAAFCCVRDDDSAALLALLERICAEHRDVRHHYLVVGFSTLQVLCFAVDEVECVFLFSGDTVVDRAHRQNSTLAGCFGHFMLRLLSEHGSRPVYWFLISKGYRTYRFLPVYFVRFYPSYDRVTPPRYARLIDAVAGRKFGDAYDSRSGLIRCRGARDRLKPEFCEVSAARRRDPHVRYFLDRDPEYGRGDELACVADIAEDNLNRYAWRAIRGVKVTWDE